MLITMPDWYSKAQEDLNEAIDNIIRENDIDWQFAHDSESLNNSKDQILSALVRIYERVNNPFETKIIKEKK